MNKTINNFITFALLFTAFSSASATPCSFDVTGDAAVTPIDALVAFEKYNDLCGASIKMDCFEICCDVDDDSTCSSDDAKSIMTRYFKQVGSDTPPVSIEEDYLIKQYRAQQTLIDLVDRMRRYQSESGSFTNSIQSLGVQLKTDALYDYQIHSIKPDLGEYKIKAAAKTTGIAQCGEGLEVWTVDQDRRFTRDAEACSGFPKATCIPCYWDYQDVIATLQRISNREKDYFSEHNAYTDNLTNLGWTTYDTDKYYYSIEVTESTYKVTATSKAPGIMGFGAGDDVWYIDQYDTIVNTVKACAFCDNSSPTIEDDRLSRIPGHYCNWGFTKQELAVETLKKIALFQETYFSEHQTYTSDMEKMASLLPYNRRYEYVVDADDTSFLATATSFMPSGDKWAIDHTGNLIHVEDNCSLCQGMTVQEIFSEALLCDESEPMSQCRPGDQGVSARIFVSESSVTLMLNLTPPNNVGAFGFAIDFNPDILSFDSFSAGSLATPLDAFDVKQPEPGTLRAGGYGLDFIPKGASGNLVAIYFKILQEAPLELTLTKFVDHMNTWREIHISIPAPSERSDLAEAIRILKILTGLPVDGFLYAQDVNGDDSRGLAEVIFLLRRAAGFL